jgi:TRAP-type C4-dicarboxylate transport system permease small subunit
MSQIGRNNHLRHAPAFLRIIASSVDWAVIAIGAVMIVLVFANVVLHVFGRDLAWVTELGELLMVWVTFMGGVAASHRGMHMSIPESLDKLSPSNRLRADLAIQLLCAAILLLLFYFGMRIVASSWNNTLTTLEWPMAWQYIPLPLAAALMLCFAGWDAYRTLRGDSHQLRYPER